MKACKDKAKRYDYSKDEVKKSKLSSYGEPRREKGKERFQGLVELRAVVLKVEPILQRMKFLDVSIRTKH